MSEAGGPSRPGRPKGGRTDARERLLVEARRQFTERGYQRTTLRAVAAACGVDMALIGYHFGSKRQLFAAAVQVPVSPTDVVEAATHNGTVIPERLLAGVIRVWEDPQTGPALRALAVAALNDDGRRHVMREYLERELVAAVARRLTGPNRERRARATAYVVGGMVLSHYILGLNGDSAPETVFSDLIGPLSAALAPGDRPPGDRPRRKGTGI